MRAKQNILINLAIALMTLIASGTVFAHSNDDYSTVPFKWQFLEKMNAEIERNLNSTKPSGIISLNLFQQKKFSSIVKNIDITFERTSAGLKVTDTSIFDTSMNSDILPFNKFLKVSMQKYFYPGYNHNRENIEWLFGEITNEKIVKHMFEGKGNLSVDLTNLEQNLLNEYGIKSGNKFQLSIPGHNFLVERTSSGLIIFNHIETENITKEDLNKNTVNDNI
jgi:hypothetical protein